VSGETAEAPLGWTPDLLRIHIERVLAERDLRYKDHFNAQEAAAALALSAVKEASDKAERERVAWQAASNEWRAAMNDRELRFMPRTESEALHHRTGENLDDLAKRTAATFSSIGSRLDLMTGRAAGSNIEARLEAIARQIDTNSSAIITEGAKAAGGRDAVIERRQSQAAVYAAVGMAITILTFLVGFVAYVAARP